MSNRIVAGGLSRFAHLAGLSRRASKADDQTDEEKKKEEEEAAKAKAEEDEEEKKRKDEEEEAAKAKANEEGEDEKEAKAFAAGASAERIRCSEIFASAAAGNNPAMAAELAFNTGLSADAAISILKTSPSSAARAGLAARMANTDPIRVGADQATEKPATKASEASQLASRTLASARAAGAKY